MSMLYLAIGALILLIVVLIRLFLLKKEMKRAIWQLQNLNQHKTGKKLDSIFSDRDFEELAKEINNQIDLTKKAEAEKRATENELKQAISHISHDIRTPMTSILGYIQLLEKEGIEREKRQEYTAVIKKSAMRLKVLLEDFFELSVIEQMDYPMKIEKISLNHLVSEVLVGFYEEFSKRNLEPSISMPNEDLEITADPSAVKRVLENLIVNALKYSSGQVHVQLDKTETAVQLAISNSVVEFNGQELHYMFDRFYKADQTRTGKGAGLGLPIAKSLMEKMDGGLSAEFRGGHLFLKCIWPNKARNDR
jgi:signal transduction histidine kinase